MTLPRALKAQKLHDTHVHTYTPDNDKNSTRQKCLTHTGFSVDMVSKSVQNQGTAGDLAHLFKEKLGRIF